MSRFSCFGSRASKLGNVLILTAVALPLLFATHQAAAATVAYWRFENGPADTAATGTGSILDSSGNHLDGNPINGPLYRTSVDDNPIPQTGATNSYSLDFNGTNQRIFVPDNPLLQLTHSLTVEAYVYPRDFATHGVPGDILLRGENVPGMAPYRLEMFNGTIGFYVVNSSNVLDGLQAVPPGLNQWIHVAATLDDTTGKIELFFNGNLVSSSFTSIRPAGPLDPTKSPGIGIGNAHSANYSEYFNGLIDEVRISDVVLSPSQFLHAPEPGSLVLFALGALGLFVVARRRRNAWR